MRLGILASHPIQYHAPLFRALASDLDVHVYFAHRQSAQQQAAAGFGVAFEWDVDLLSGYESEFLTNRAATPGVDRFFDCDTPDVITRIRRERFDAFLVTGWNLKSFWQAIGACRTTGTPVLVRGDSQLATSRTVLQRLRNEVTHRAMLRSFDGFLVVGARNREYLRHYGVPSRRLFDAPHFVDNEWFAARAAEARRTRDALRATLGFAPATQLVLFAGKLIPEKRPLDLVLALEMLRRTRDDVGLVVVGAGPLEAELRRVVAERELPVAFVGFKNQSALPSYYALADLLALPSESETWGLVVNEAMACGLAAVVSDVVGCAPDLVHEGTTGARFPVGDVAELARAIDRALPLRARPETQAELARLLARYSLDSAAAGVKAAVEQLAGHRRPQAA